MITTTRIAVAAAALVCQVSAQADTTDCETAYNTATGTANCGGLAVDVLALVCGQNFVQNDCVAKWNNGGENEWFFFMGAGAGMSAGMLPAACSALPSGLAMVQYFPDKIECYPAADLGGTTLTYTASTDPSRRWTSVTVNFAEHDDGSATRNGYIKLTCADHKGEFTTIGDSNQASFYEVDVAVPCPVAPPSPPGPPVAPGDFRCVQDRCVDAGPGGGLSNATCHAVCGPKPAKFACVDNRCVRSDHGLPTEAECVEFCNPPGARHLPWSAIELVAGPKATATPDATPRELL